MRPLPGTSTGNAPGAIGPMLPRGVTRPNFMPTYAQLGGKQKTVASMGSPITAEAKGVTATLTANQT